MEAGGVFAVAVIPTTLEDDGGDLGPGDEIEDVFVPVGEMSVVQFP